MNLSNKKFIITLIALYLLTIAIALFDIFTKRTGSETGIPKEMRMPFRKIKSAEPAIAVVPIYGVITVGDQSAILGSMSADKITKRLKSLSEREDIKAVVLRINSPGGTVGAVQEICEEVMRLKKSGKKVLVSMGDVAASGGYYVAASADKIFALPGTITGSIGVIFETGNVQELFKKVGVKMEAIKSAEHKDIGSPFRTMTEKEKHILQSLIDDAYSQFVNAIVEGRKMKREKVLMLADGRIFTGAQARSEGLIDEFGNLEFVIEKAAEMAQIKGKPKIIYEEDRPLERLLSFLSSESRKNFLNASVSKMGVRFAYIWEYSL